MWQSRTSPVRLMDSGATGRNIANAHGLVVVVFRSPVVIVIILGQRMRVHFVWVNAYDTKYAIWSRVPTTSPVSVRNNVRNTITRRIAKKNTNGCHILIAVCRIQKHRFNVCFSNFTHFILLMPFSFGVQMIRANCTVLIRKTR